MQYHLIGGFVPGCHCDEALGNDCRFAMILGMEWNESAADDEEPGEEEAGEESETEEKKDPAITRVIDRSPDSARIILFASNSFLTDTMLDLAASGMGTRILLANPNQPLPAMESEREGW